jgi:mevalonate pyrophosphate decarboxylase
MNATAIAFPGLPVVFAEGYGSVESRVSYHSHASFALTGLDKPVRTETTVEESDETTFTLNGREVTDLRSKSVFKVLEDMKKITGYEGGLKIESVNHNIYSGSSDSGAAALVTVLNDFFKLNLGEKRLCELGRPVSETVYRSIYGGLSVYEITGGRVEEYQLLCEKDLGEIIAYAVPFNLPRLKADTIHQAVVKHPKYFERAVEAEQRVIKLKEATLEGDLKQILFLMESDARRAHQMFDDVGCSVIKPEIRRLCNSVEEWGKTTPVYWNVAGGSIVYVFSLKEHKGEIEELLNLYGKNYLEYKIAGGAKIRL